LKNKKGILFYFLGFCKIHEIFIWEKIFGKILEGGIFGKNFRGEAFLKTATNPL
jgi:hypothetical protein